MLELAYMLDSGVSMIEFIKEKLQLLCLREGIPEFQDNNVASVIERASVAINALLITGKDMDNVVCVTCGMTPKIVMSDGNSKDTIQVTKHMVYNFEETSTIPSLEDFVESLAKQLLRSSYFQDEKKEKIDMTKLPVIMAPKILKSQVNSDHEKKTLFNKKVQFNSDTFKGLAELIRDGKIDITNLESLSQQDIKWVSKELKLKMSKKSNTRLLEEIKSVCSAFIAGQGKY